MDTFLVPVTFPDLDTAEREAPSLVDALRTAGVDAEVVGEPSLDSSDDDAGRPDPGPVTREVRVRAAAEDDARARVQEVADARYPPGMLLLGPPTPL